MELGFHHAVQLEQHEFVNSSAGKRANIALESYMELARGGNMSQGSGLGRPSVADPPLSPISETPPPMLDDSVELLQVSNVSKSSGLVKQVPVIQARLSPT